MRELEFAAQPLLSNQKVQRAIGCLAGNDSGAPNCFVGRHVKTKSCGSFSTLSHPNDKSRLIRVFRAVRIDLGSAATCYHKGAGCSYITISLINTSMERIPNRNERKPATEETQRSLFSIPLSWETAKLREGISLDEYHFCEKMYYEQEAVFVRWIQLENEANFASEDGLSEEDRISLRKIRAELKQIVDKQGNHLVALRTKMEGMKDRDEIEMLKRKPEFAQSLFGSFEAKLQNYRN